MRILSKLTRIKKNAFMKKFRPAQRYKFIINCISWVCCSWDSHSKLQKEAFWILTCQSLDLILKSSTTESASQMAATSLQRISRDSTTSAWVTKWARWLQRYFLKSRKRSWIIFKIVMFDINVGNAPADISEGDVTEEHSKLGRGVHIFNFWPLF